MKTITVLIKPSYGRDLIYPIDDNAKRFASLVGQKTLSERHLKLIRELGFDIRFEAYNPLLNKGYET